ncbi:MAG: transglycosylase SLT domain-containing protein [Deinococcales bacterium]
MSKFFSFKPSSQVRSQDHGCETNKTLSPWLRAAALMALAVGPMLSLGLTREHLFTAIPQVEVQTVQDPYDVSILAPYKRFRDALLAKDVPALQSLLADSKGLYLEYQTALTLARLPNLSFSERLSYYPQALSLFTDDPLMVVDKKALWLEYAQTAESAGVNDTAIQAYQEALPSDEAIAGLKRLESNSFKLANSFLNASLYRESLRSLGDNDAPSISAPAYRWTYQNDEALSAYENWLAEEPSSFSAQLGRAWILYRLGRYDEADDAFATLSGTDALWGRALIAEAQGNFDKAIGYYLATRESRFLWEAARLYERNEQLPEALALYLNIAALGDDLNDDAAFRALTLAESLDDQASLDKAQSLLPKRSFFRLVRGEQFQIAFSEPQAPVTPYALDLALALEDVGDNNAALGELAFALRSAKDEATMVALAKALQDLGEYRHSSRAAESYLWRGSQNLDTWRLAYPKAYPAMVENEATKQELDPELVWAVMRVESRFFPRALSSANAKGLMQFIPSTWEWMAEYQKESPGDPYEPRDNIRYGTVYLRYLLNYFDGDVELAIPSYNGGQGYIRKLYESSAVAENKVDFYRLIDKRETREYLQKVMVDYAIYKALYALPE